MNLNLSCGVLVIPDNLISKNVVIQQSKFEEYKHFCKVFGLKPKPETLQVFLKFKEKKQV